MVSFSEPEPEPESTTQFSQDVSDGLKDITLYKPPNDNPKASRANRKFYESSTNQAILGVVKSLSITFSDGVNHMAKAREKEAAKRRKSFKPGALALNRRKVNVKSKGWKWIRTNRKLIILYGQRNGILADPKRKAQIAADDKQPETSSEEQLRGRNKKVEIKGLQVKDKSMIHSAIPFLPFPAAISCAFLNVVTPGIGTMLTGVLLLCMGKPRILYRNSRIIASIAINFLVGLFQMMTITFLLVGWFWSIAWGYLMIAHSLQYREAVAATREEFVAEVALEAFSKGEILRRRNLTSFITQNRKKKVVEQNKDAQEIV